MLRPVKPILSTSEDQADHVLRLFRAHDTALLFGHAPDMVVRGRPVHGYLDGELALTDGSSRKENRLRARKPVCISNLGHDTHPAITFSRMEKPMTAQTVTIPHRTAIKSETRSLIPPL